MYCQRPRSSSCIRFAFIFSFCFIQKLAFEVHSFRYHFQRYFIASRFNVEIDLIQLLFWAWPACEHLSIVSNFSLGCGGRHAWIYQSFPTFQLYWVSVHQFTDRFLLFFGTWSTCTHLPSVFQLCYWTWSTCIHLLIVSYFSLGRGRHA